MSPPSAPTELDQLVVSAKVLRDDGAALEVVADRILHRHPDAAVQLDRLLADRAGRTGRSGSWPRAPSAAARRVVVRPAPAGPAAPSTGPARARRTCPPRGTAAPGTPRSAGRTARGSSGSRRSSTASAPSRRPPRRTAPPSRRRSRLDDASMASAGSPSSVAGRVGEQHVRAAQAVLHARRRRAMTSARVDQEQPDAAVGRRRGDDQRVGAVAAEHRDLLAGDRPAVAVCGCGGRGDVGQRPAACPARRRRTRAAARPPPPSAGCPPSAPACRPRRPARRRAPRWRRTARAPASARTTPSRWRARPAPIPAPPYCSSKVSPSRPSSAYCCHSSRLQPSSDVEQLRAGCSAS